MRGPTTKAGLVTAGAVMSIMAIKEDEMLYVIYERESEKIRAEARVRSEPLPQYPEYLNKGQYTLLDPEDQLEYREQAIEASETRRHLLVQTVLYG